MKLDKNTLVIVLLLFIGALLVFSKIPQSCNFSNKKSDTIIVRDTAWITKIEKYPVYTPGPIRTLPGDTEWLYLPIDTMALLRDYHTMRIYNDTIRIGTFGYASWIDTVAKNKIVKRHKSLKYEIPIITKTITINNYYKQKRQLNTTVLLDLPRFTIYGGLLYEDRKDKIYQFNVGYGLNGPTFNVGMSFPLWTESSLILIK